MISQCSCSHEFQDQFYGKGRRVFNVGKTSAKCTVCQKSITLTSEQQKNAKKDAKSK